MIRHLILACGLALLLSPYVLANDLDDGIAIDEHINDNLKPGINIEFIVRRALAQAKAAEKRGKNEKDEQIKQVGVGNIVVGPGANLNGAVIVNLSNNKDSVVVSKKR